MTPFPLPRPVAATLAALLLFAPGETSRAQSGEEPWTLRVGVQSVYDNNILKYSEKYLDRFRRREDEGRFHIGTSDDLILSSSLRLERSLVLFDRFPTSLTADGRLATYMRNGIKNWWSLSGGIRQQIPGRLTFAFSYIHIPDFYVRHYGDEDWLDVVGAVPARFQPYAFAKDEFRSSIQWTAFTSTRLRIAYSAMEYYHTPHFTEYDCRNGQWGFDASHPLTDRIRVSAGYAYLASDAAGFDAPGETLESSDDVDGSFEEDAYSVGVTWRLPRLFGLDARMSAEGEYSRRCFTTGHPVERDPYHAGRVDDEFRLSFDWTLRLGAAWELNLGTAWRLRDAWTRADGNSETVSDEKDYQQYQLELGCTYAITF